MGVAQGIAHAAQRQGQVGGGVVLEVDGSSHYATLDGRQPDPARSAENMRADRDLKLSGYEVFRFGATELQDPQAARELLQAFFTDLFRQFGVTPRTTT
ncbi:MAG: hypothetical protein IIA03_05600 [Proteobacteria bacterium]|nr:hypothetical protein [Pseudomonadota bacterium]